VSTVPTKSSTDLTVEDGTKSKALLFTLTSQLMVLVGALTLPTKFSSGMEMVGIICRVQQKLSESDQPMMSGAQTHMETSSTVQGMATGKSLMEMPVKLPAEKTDMSSVQTTDTNSLSEMELVVTGKNSLVLPSKLMLGTTTPLPVLTVLTKSSHGEAATGPRNLACANMSVLVLMITTTSHVVTLLTRSSVMVNITK